MKYIYLLSILLLVGSCKQASSDSTTSDTTREPLETKTDTEPGIPLEISSSQLRYMIVKNKDMVLLDVRTPDEIAAGKIAGALEADYFSDNFSAEIDKLDKDKHYIVYCKSGGRSSKSIDLMRKKGFRKCTNLEGGYTAWNASK